MSRLMIDAFFPASVEQVERFWLGKFVLTELVFPHHVSEKCPEVVVEVFGGMPVRQPALAASATLGMVIGMYCGMRLWNVVNGMKGTQRRATIRLWALAFLFFGTMNLSALPLHCLLAAPQTSYPVDNPMWWSIDTYMTGASSICLLMASEPSRIVQRIGCSLHTVGSVCLCWFWLTASSIGLERWYLYPPLLAGAPVVHFLFQKRYLYSRRFPLGHFLFAVGAATANFSICLDRPLCDLLGPAFVDAFTASNGVFLACDLGFLGIYMVVVRSVGDGESKKEK